VQQRLDRRRAYDTLGALLACVQRTAAEPVGVRPPLAPLTLLIDHSQRLMAHLSMVRLILQRDNKSSDGMQADLALNAIARGVDEALVPSGQQSAPAPVEEFIVEPPGEPTSQLWLQWRLKLTQRDAVAVGQSAQAALEAIRGRSNRRSA